MICVLESGFGADPSLAFQGNESLTVKGRGRVRKGREGKRKGREGEGIGKGKGKGNGKLSLAVLVLAKWIPLCFSSSLCVGTGKKKAAEIEAS